MNIKTHIFKIKEKTIIIKINWNHSYWKSPVAYTFYKNRDRKTIWAGYENVTLEDIVLHEMDSILEKDDWSLLKTSLYGIV